MKYYISKHLIISATFPEVYIFILVSTHLHLLIGKTWDLPCGPDSLGQCQFTSVILV